MKAILISACFATFLPLDAFAADVARPDDQYFAAYVINVSAEKMAARGEYEKALKGFRAAYKQIDEIVRQFPGWQSEMVKMRQNRIRTKIREMEVKARLARVG